MKQIIHCIRQIMHNASVITAGLCMITYHSIYPIGDMHSTSYYTSISLSPDIARHHCSTRTKGTYMLISGICGMCGLTWSSIVNGWSSRFTFALAADGFLLCFGTAALGLYLMGKNSKQKIAERIVRV